MPTTSVEFSSRTYGSPGYQERLRRPAYLEGLGFTRMNLQPKATIYQPPPPATFVPPPPETEYVPATYQEGQEAPPPVDLQPLEPAPLDVHKSTSPWVWAAGGGSALVIFWLLFRRKRKG